jgi:cell division protein FtsZ
VIFRLWLTGEVVGEVNRYIIGVGSAGINILNHLSQSKILGADLIAIDTDLQKLHHSKADCSLYLGEEKHRVHELVNNTIGLLTSAYRQASVIYLLAGFGGKTATAAVPILAREAKKRGVTVHLLAVEPMLFEGQAKSGDALTIIDELKGELDSVVRLSNEDMSNLFSDDKPLVKGFSQANEVFARIISEAESVDFSVH